MKTTLVELPAPRPKPTFAAGQRVIVGRNDAHVTPGTLGAIVRQQPETGNWIVAIGPERRPVAFTADALKPVVAPQEAGRPEGNGREVVVPDVPPPAARSASKGGRPSNVWTEEQRQEASERAKAMWAKRDNGRRLAVVDAKTDPIAAGVLALRRVLAEAATGGAAPAALGRLVEAIAGLER